VSSVSARQDVIAALGRGIATEDGLRVLASTATDSRLGGDAVQAIARSPHPLAMATLVSVSRMQTPAARRLAVRGYVLRALVRNERSASLEDSIDAMRGSRDATDRALAAFARVALGKDDVSSWISDLDPAVRRAAALASLARWDGRRLPASSTLLARYVHENDEATRSVLALGLLDGDPSAVVPTLALVQRVEAGSADAFLSATALAARKGESQKDKIDALLASTDPVMRAHVARGLGASEEPSATGRLAEAARYEPEPLVRYAETAALARRASAPTRTEILETTARFDPEARIREVASRALENATPPSVWPVREVAWLRVATADGQAPSDGGGSPMLGSFVTSGGVAIPISFDADGYALVAGLPPGDGRLILAPVLPRR